MSQNDTQTTLWRRILCRIGIHDWEYYGDALNGKGVRECRRCPRTELAYWISYDGNSAVIRWRRTYDR